jgi:hypothetical protein
VATTILADHMPGGLRFVAKMIGLSPEEGAQTSLYLATSAEVEGVSGKYFVNQRVAQSSKASCDKAGASRLWQVSTELTGLPVSA